MISNYGSLLAAAALWLDRTDLTQMLPEFVALAEADVRKGVKVCDMLTLNSGAVMSGLIARPSRLGEIRWLKVDGVNTSQPDFVIDKDVIRLRDNTAKRYELQYWRYYPALVNVDDTNWILDNYPDVYLYATVAYGCQFRRDFDGYQRYMDGFRARAMELNAAEKAKLWSGPLKQVLNRVVV